jgi:hypothetical protein
VAGAFLSGDTRRAVTLASIRSGRLQAGLPLVPEADEVLDVLAEGESARVERIVSTGQVTPEGEWYDQVWDEFVLVVSGPRVCASRAKKVTAASNLGIGCSCPPIAAIA